MGSKSLPVLLSKHGTYDGVDDITDDIAASVNTNLSLPVPPAVTAFISANLRPLLYVGFGSMMDLGLVRQMAERIVVP